MKKIFFGILYGFVLSFGTSVCAYFPLLWTDFQAWYKADSLSSSSTWSLWSDSYWQDGRFDLQKGTGNSFVYTTNGMNFNPTLFFDATKLNNYHPDNIALQWEHKIFAVIKPSWTSGPINTIINGQCPNDQSCPRPDFYITAWGYPEYFAGAVGVDGSIPRYGINHPMNTTTSIIGKPTLMSVQSNQTNPAWSYWVYDHPLSWWDGLNSRAFIKKNGLDIGVYEFLNNSQRDDSGIPREYNIWAWSKSANFGYQVWYDYLVGQEANLKPFQWEIAELIVYKWASNQTAQSNSIRSVESYLALKYGLTLEQIWTWQHYLDGSGNVVWNASNNSWYKNNIFGIWRDDSTSLYQKQSQSVNTGVLTIALDQLASTNQDNTSTLSDRNFIIGWDNNWTLNLSESFNGNINSRLWRVWKFEKTWTDTPLIEMIFTWITTSWLSLIVSTDEVFDMWDTIIPLSGDRVSYTPTSSILYVSLVSTPPTGYYPWPINYPIPWLKDHSLAISNLSWTTYTSTPILSGTTAANAFVTVTLSWTQYTWYADGSGNWSIVPATLSTGVYTATVTAMITWDSLDEYNTGIVTRLVQQFASTSFPNFLAFDFQGNLFTTNGNDCAGSTITQVTPLWVVSTLSETVAHTRCGLVFDSQWNLFVSSSTASPQSISKVVTWWTATLFATPTNAWSFGLWDMVFDTMWNMYVTARWNNVIQKISSAWVVSTFATGFVNSFWITIDNNENIYVAEYWWTIKKITPSWNKSTFATWFVSTSDAVFDLNDNMYVSDWLWSTIYKITPSWNKSIFATWLWNATSLAFGDDWNLYVSRRPNNRIDRVYASQSLLTISTTFSIVWLLPPPAPTIFYPWSWSTITDITPTFSGTGSTSWDIITLTIYGVQYTGMVQSDLTWSITPSDVKLPDNRSYTISVTETNAWWTSPATIETFRVQRYTPDTKDVNLTISNVSGAVSCMLPTLTGTATPWSTVVATLSWYSFTWTADGSGNYAIPLSWNFADGNYTVDTTVIVTGSALDSYTTGTFSTVNSIFATWLSLPIWITFNAYNNIYIGNYGNDTVVTMSWWMLIPYANWFNHTVDIVFDIRWNLYVSNDLSHTISKVNIWWTVSTFAWWFTWPHWLLYDSLWRMYVTNRNWNTISQLTTWWIWSTFINGLNKPEFMVFDTNNNIYVANFGNNIISRITWLWVISNFSSWFWGSRGIAIDIFNNIYVANSTSNTISKITPLGVVTTFVGSWLSWPFGMAFDNYWNLFVANPSNNTVSKITSQSTLTKSITFTKNCNALVTFVDYDGTVLQTWTVQYGSSAVAPANPTRTGYTFSWWNPSDLSNITGDRIFTGEYTINYYTLSFEENGGSNVLDQTGIAYNTTGVVPVNPIKTWYYFSGWYLSWSSIPFDFSTLITGDTIVYAYWNTIPVITYTLSFEENWWTPILDQTGIVYNTPWTDPWSPTRVWYTFSGWYLSGASNPFDFSTPLSWDTTLYAQWNLISVALTYTLFFEENGWTLVTDQTGITLNGTGNQPTNPIRTGYTFGWWYTSPAFTTLYNFSTVITWDTTVYAKWTEQSSWWWGGWWYTIPYEEVFNDTIGTTCFTPWDKRTIDQWNNVTESFKIAHQMLYSYELTKWQGTRDYRPFDYLTREEAARFMVEFAENVLCRKKTRTYNNNFSDLWWSNPTLTRFIRESYEYEIFNGDKGVDDQYSTTFRPQDRISKNELAAIMVRLVTNTILEEPETDWSQHYRIQLNKYARLTQLNDRGRGNIAEVMYDLYRNNTYILQDVWYVIQ